ncbi:MAG TPA: glutathione S-transferase family protein [Steroidobacteraceae bacterium]|nr:glutathione S-transferase family protein [Steroidobacteraceae bacterium]
MPLKLVIGLKNYSSWSLRPWMLLKHLDLAFEEIPLEHYGDGYRAQIAKYSPAGRVPVLVDGDIPIWDSLAIVEHLAEKTGRGWPKQPAARALARSISAEMHSGFTALRSQCSMNIRATGRRVELTPDLKRDVERIDEIWRDARERFGSGGPWLFGDYSIADAMYAPVVTRFNTYGFEVSSISRAYMRTVLEDPAFKEWARAAEVETFRNPVTDAIGLPKNQA